MSTWITNHQIIEAFFFFWNIVDLQGDLVKLWILTPGIWEVGWGPMKLHFYHTSRWCGCCWPHALNNKGLKDETHMKFNHNSDRCWPWGACVWLFLSFSCVGPGDIRGIYSCSQPHPWSLELTLVYSRCGINVCKTEGLSGTGREAGVGMMCTLGLWLQGKAYQL